MVKPLKLSVRDKKILKMIIPIVALVIVYMGLFRWYLPQYTELTQQLTDLESEIHQLELSGDSLADLEQELANEKQYLELEASRYEWDVLQGDTLVLLGEKAQELGLGLSSLSQGEGELQGDIWHVPYYATVNSSFHELKDYLKALDRHPKAYYYKSVALELPRINSPSQVKLELELVAQGNMDYRGNMAYISSQIFGREDMFDPTMIIPYPPIKLVPESGGDSSRWEREQRVIPPPRYDFPSENEVGAMIIP